MTLWDGLGTDSQDSTSNRIMIIGATNRIQDLDAAILRRMPTRYHIPLPNEKQREKIFSLILQNEQLHSNVNLKKLAHKTIYCTGSDINEICRQAAMQRVVEACQQSEKMTVDRLRSITQEDFVFALKKIHHNLE